MDFGPGTVLPICEIQLAQDTSFVLNNNELQYCTHQKQESLVLFFFAFFFYFLFHNCSCTICSESACSFLKAS